MLDLAQDPVALTAALVDVPSVSGTEEPLADLVHDALMALPHLTVVRDGNNVIARTTLGRERRVLLAGHLDTVPIADNVPSRLDGGLLYGCGTSDMKSGDELPRGEAPERAVCVGSSRVKSFAGGDFGMPCLLVLRRLEPGQEHDKLALNDVLREHGVAP